MRYMPQIHTCTYIHKHIPHSHTCTHTKVHTTHNNNNKLVKVSAKVRGIKVSGDCFSEDLLSKQAPACLELRDMITKCKHRHTGCWRKTSRLRAPKVSGNSLCLWLMVNEENRGERQH